MNRRVTGEVPLSTQVPETFNMAELLLRIAGAPESREVPALYYQDQVVTYGQLLQLANRAGNALRQLGVRRPQRVLLALPDSPAFVATFLGVMKIGAVPVPVTTLARPSEYSYFLSDSYARVLVVSAKLLSSIECTLGEIPTLKAIVVVGDQKAPHLNWEELVSRASPELDFQLTHRDEMSYWLYSSGTTGRPKAVIHLHADMVHCLHPFQSEIARLKPTDRVFSVPKMGFSYGLVNSLYLPLLTGSSSVLFPDRPEPAKVLEIIHRYRPTVFFSVPTSYLRLLQYVDQERPPLDFDSIRLWVSAGEPLPANLYQQWRDRFGVEVLDGLGSTEVGYIYVCSRPGQARPGSCGQLLPGYESKLVDEKGDPVGSGDLGELWLKGESLAAGYWHDEPKTRSSFLGPWFRTGDVLSQDSEGYYRYVSRRDDLFKVAGHWVSPLELEEQLRRHVAVAECAAVGIADSYGLAKPHAYVCLKDGLVPSKQLENELREFLRGKLEPFKIPRRLEFVGSLPRTTTGKIQRVRLRAPLHETSLEGRRRSHGDIYGQN